MNRSLNIQLLPFLKSASLKRGAIFGGILISALLAFEIFNFGTTSFALRDVLGDLQFAGLYWSSILAFAFCGIDFAGVARIFTPEQGRDEPAEVWYLFGAWLLAAGFNAMLTWWGVSVAILNHSAEGGSLIGQASMTKVVPIFVAGMVWLIRVLIIGTFSVQGSASSRLRMQGNDQPLIKIIHHNQLLRTNLCPFNRLRAAPLPCLFKIILALHPSHALSQLPAITSITLSQLIIQLA